MSAAAATTDQAARVARWYTAARRHPWVVGKFADWKIPMGPFRPAQIAVAVGGGLLLVPTVAWWSWMGPVPLVAWAVAVWVVRRQKFGGRAPLPAALGWLALAAQPPAGRIGGRAARDRAPRSLLGAFGIEDLKGADAPVVGGAQPGVVGATTASATTPTTAAATPEGQRDEAAAHTRRALGRASRRWSPGPSRGRRARRGRARRPVETAAVSPVAVLQARAAARARSAERGRP